MNDRRYATKTLLCGPDRVGKHVSHPRFKAIRQVGNETFCLTKSKETIKLLSPIFIGGVILQKAKLINYKFHHWLAKPSGNTFPEKYIRCESQQDRELIQLSRKFLKKVTLLYCDTDSFLYLVETAKQGLTYDFIMTHLFPKKYLDRSNFKVLDKLEGTYQPGELGLLKSELSDDIAEEAVIINPKSYSIKTRKRQHVGVCSVSDTELSEVRAGAMEEIKVMVNERLLQQQQQQQRQQQQHYQ